MSTSALTHPSAGSEAPPANLGSTVPHPLNLLSLQTSSIPLASSTTEHLHSSILPEPEACTISSFLQAPEVTAPRGAEAAPSPAVGGPTPPTLDGGRPPAPEGAPRPSRSSFRDPYLPNEVASSARTFAAYRALESLRPDALFVDPLAALLAGEEAIASKRQNLTAEMGGRFSVRTRWFDDELVAALEQLSQRALEEEEGSNDGAAEDKGRGRPPDGRRPQVVNVGAGMDARPWRLPPDRSPCAGAPVGPTQDIAPAEQPPRGKAPLGVPEESSGTAEATHVVAGRGGVTGSRATGSLGGWVFGATASTVYEVESEAVMELKERLLQEAKGRGEVGPLRLAEKRMVVPADLQHNAWQSLLLQAGFDPTLLTVWLMEGLLMYLAPAAVRDLVTWVASVSPCGSIFLASGIDTQALANGIASQSALMNAWQWGHDDPEAFFKAAGWRVVKVEEARVVGPERYKRQLVERAAQRGRPRGRAWLVVAVRE